MFSLELEEGAPAAPWVSIVVASSTSAIAATKTTRRGVALMTRDM
jgi:hypothetical protein